MKRNLIYSWTFFATFLDRVLFVSDAFLSLEFFFVGYF